MSEKETVCSTHEAGYTAIGNHNRITCRMTSLNSIDVFYKSSSPVRKVQELHTS